MNRLLNICSIVLLLLCLLLFAVISSYKLINLLVSCSIIVITSIILQLLHKMIKNNAFKASLTLLFTIFGVLSLIASFFAPQHLYNNWLIISFIILSCVEILVLFIVKHINKHNTK